MISSNTRFICFLGAFEDLVDTDSAEEDKPRGKKRAGGELRVLQKPKNELRLATVGRRTRDRNLLTTRTPNNRSATTKKRGSFVDEKPKF